MPDNRTRRHRHHFRSRARQNARDHSHRNRQDRTSASNDVRGDHASGFGRRRRSDRLLTMDARGALTVVDLGVVDYDAALAIQTAMLAARIDGTIGDTLLMMEHPHVVTLGRGAAERLIVGNPASVPIRRVSRGGQVTYHGPGQLIGYPILKLEGRDRDVHRYLRSIEEAMIRALADCEIAATRREGLTGIWVGARKIGSIGVGIKRWTTCHGFALNVCPDLSYFSGIVPCGIDGCEM